MEERSNQSNISMSINKKIVIILLLIIVPVLILFFFVYLLFFNYPVDSVVPDQKTPQNIPIELVEPIEGAGRS